MLYLCSCVDGSNALLLRPHLFHAEQMDNSPLTQMHVRWRVIGDDLAPSYLHWTESILKPEQSHLIIQPFSDAHVLVAEFRETDADPWRTCPSIRVGIMQALIRLTFDYDFSANEEEVHVMAMLTGAQGERVPVLFTKRGDITVRPTRVWEGVMVAHASSFGYLLHAAGEIQCGDPTVKMEIIQRLPIQFEICPPHRVMQACAPAQMAVFTLVKGEVKELITPQAS